MDQSEKSIWGRSVNLQLFGEGDVEPNDVPAEPVGWDGLPETVRVGENEGIPVDVSRDELRKHYEAYSNDESWKAKNTQVAQELARERDELKQTQQLERFLNTNPEKLADIEKIIQGSSQSNVAPEIKQQLSEMQQIAFEAKKQNALNRVDRDLDYLTKKHEWFFKDNPRQKQGELVKYAMEHNDDNLARAFRDMTYDQQKEMGLKEGAENARKGLRSNRDLGLPKGSAGSTKGFDPKTATNDQIEAAILNDPKYNFD